MQWDRGAITRERLRAPPPPRRRNVPYALAGVVLCLAFFLLFMAVLLPLVIAPRAARLPLAPYAVLVAVGAGSYFAPSQGQLVTSDALVGRLTIRGALEAGSDEVAVWDTFVSLEDLRPTVVPGERVISAVRERVALDRTTGRPVACCGEDPVHEGITHRFPFGTETGEYLLWDPVLREGRPARFQRTDRVGALAVYVFICQVQPTPIGTQVVPGALVGADTASLEVSLVHAVDRELWVEPRTGRIVREVTDVRQTLQGEGIEPARFATVRMAWNDETVDEQAGIAAREVARLEGVSSILPLTATVAGVILLAVGVILLVLANSAREDG